MAIQRRTRSVAKAALSDSLRHFLLTGNYRLRELFPNCPGRAEVFRLANTSYCDRLRKVWEIHRSEILRDWEREGKAGVPWGARVFDAKKGGRKND